MFYVSDSVRYIESYLNNRDNSFKFEDVLSTLLVLGDADILYEFLLNKICYIANTYLDGATVFYMTLIQTLFGIMTMLVLYVILVPLYKVKAYKYVLTFSLCSLFLTYSCLIIRDIIIAYCFIEIFNIILNDDFKWHNVIWIILFIFLALGIRLQSGLFAILFLFFYVYLGLRNTSLKYVVVPLLIILGVIVLFKVFSTVLYQDSMDLISLRDEQTREMEEEVGGLYTFFYKFPPGIRQFFLFFYTQIVPFPPLNALGQTTTPLQYVVAIDVVVYEIYWFFISFTLFLGLFFKRAYEYCSGREIVLLIISFVYIILLTSHPDIRRMMPVYPMMYLIYLKIINHEGLRWTNKTHGQLILCYLGMLVFYFAIKGF